MTEILKEEVEKEDLEKAEPEKEEMVSTEEPETAADSPADGEEDAESKKKDKKADKKSKAEIARLTEALEKAEAALKEEQDKFLRMAAEYENFRRRSAKEKESIWGDAVADTVKEILPVFDNLERAGLYKDAEKVAEGLALTAKSAKSLLEKLGIEEYGKVGDEFNPDIHNAVMHEENEALEQNTISEVFQSGFRRGDHVIRFAMVKVAN